MVFILILDESKRNDVDRTAEKSSGGTSLSHSKNTKNMEHIQSICIFKKIVMLHRFKQNGLQIRNQRKKLHMVAPGKMIFSTKFSFFAKNIGF